MDKNRFPPNPSGAVAQNYNSYPQNPGFGQPQPAQGLNTGWMMPPAAGPGHSAALPPQLPGYNAAFPAPPQPGLGYPQQSAMVPPQPFYGGPQNTPGLGPPQPSYSQLQQPRNSVPMPAYNPLGHGGQPQIPIHPPIGAVSMHLGKDEEKRLKKMHKEQEKMEKKQRKAMKNLH